MKQLKLSIKPKQEPTEGQRLHSSGYSIKINDWELGRGVTSFRLEMPAEETPKITITAIPDVMEIDATVIADIQSLRSEETPNYKDDEQQKAFLEGHILSCLKIMIFIQRLSFQQMEFIWSKHKSFTCLMKLNWIDDELEVSLDELR